MKIYITQGHESGIGIEIFLKSYLLLNKELKSKIIFIGYPHSIQKTISLCGIPSNILDHLNIQTPKKNIFSESLSCLLYALELITDKDILITQPTSKNQLFFDNIEHLGHTEFFRHFYKNKNIPMSFISSECNICLVSDHIKLSDVPKISQDEIVAKVKLTISGLKKINRKVQKIFLSGINPHCGENGIIGNEDSVIGLAKSNLAESVESIGPISGDAIFKSSSINHLLVYMFHDQALSYFKSQSGMLGINITFGLPYLRLSVDHGTAFELYGKNTADVSSMIYIFQFISGLKDVN